MFVDRLNESRAQLDGAVPNGLETIEPKRRHSPTAMANDLICTHDFEGRILSVNGTACEALGAPAAALSRLTIQELLPEGAASDFDAYIQRLRRQGLDAGMMRVVTRDGERIWEYRSRLDSDATPAPIIHCVARDVTEREEAFQEVRRSEEQFRSIIENISDIAAIIELDGRIRYESPSVERVLGYPSKAFIGIPFIDLVHLDDAGRAARFLALQISDVDASQTIELRIRHRDGAWRSFEIVARNLIKKEQISAIVINARDITERKLLQTQLVQANRLGGLGRLAATVAHEFNNVLMGMQPFAELMQRPDAKPPMISKGAWHISNSIQRGKRIVMDILRFTQPHVPLTTAVDLGEWWDTFIPEAEAVLGNMIAVESAIPSRGLFVIADRAQLSQVMANLVANARDAMPGGGTVSVAAHGLAPDVTFPFGVVPHSEGFVEISVRDTGGGMPPDVMDRIFEPLYTTKESGGTGLGLAVAHQILTRHGGYIFVESEPGRGSTFHLLLPRTTRLSSDMAAATGPGRIPVARKLLMIEDEQAIVEGITALLELDGIEVQAIGNGNETAEALARFHPDAVLLDYGLPGMDGSQVYAQIRALDPLLPVIFASGHGDRRLEDGIEDPRTRFLQKPFNVADLLEMIVDLEVGGSA